MERAKRAAHVVANASDTDLSSASNATVAAPPLDEPWSVNQVLNSTQLNLSKVLATLPATPSPNPSTPIPFLHILERLKTTPREGWRRFSIPGPESISDHMYRMSILTVLCPSPLRQKLDIPRCTLLALCHDMAESLVGDITPVDGVSKTEKRRREGDTMSYLTGKLLGPSTGCAEAGTLLREAWEEYEASTTPEAKFVHDIDKLELLIQMMEYERRGEGRVDLGEFLWVAEGIKMKEMKAWCSEVLREREEYWNGVGKVPGGVDIAKTLLARGEEKEEIVGKMLKRGEEGKKVGISKD
ncbi:MAG: hypothetical protein Q9178_006862 [Gyalolechia marmorata]